MDKQHFYFNETGIGKDNSAGIRTAQEYYKAVAFLENGDLFNGTLHLGIMTHYISDLAVYHNVMNSTYWGTPSNYNEYLNYVNLETQSYTSSKFDKYLKFDGTLFILPPEDAANAVAYNTTFDTIGINTRTSDRAPNSGLETCSWMNANYDWQDPAFKDRCGQSLNYAVNIITDVLHTLYVYNNSAPAAPKNLRVTKTSGHSITLTWDKNSEQNLGGYSIYINKTGSIDKFVDLPINISKKYTSYEYTGLDDEATYYFKITAYNILNKSSEFSIKVSGTTKDVTPPPIPKLGSIPEITNEQKLDITGFYTAEPGALIEVFINDYFTKPAASNYSNAEYLGYYKLSLTLIQGNNTIRLRAVDSSGNPSEVSEAKTIILDSIKPHAEAGENIELQLKTDPIIVQFDGSNSTDDLGIIENYTWTLDYNYKIYELFGVSPKFSFDEPGEYICELKVMDRAQNSDTDKFWINVTQLDIIAPYILTKTPDDDQINVSINITIKVTFSEPLNPSKLKVRLVSNIEGELQIPKPTYDPRLGLTLKPFMNLTHSRIYNIIITGVDLAGNDLIGGVWYFTTELRPADYDGDQLPDIWEWQNGLDANRSDSQEDPDYDKLTNFDEYNNGFNSTNPKKADTDDDGMSDYFERKFNLKPLDPSDRDLDPDNDGKTNYEEYLGLDGLPGNQDWTDPNERPEGKSNKTSNDKDEDYMIIWVIIIIILITMVILILLARRVRYKETGIQAAKSDSSDDYLKVKDPTELGIGGDLLYEESKDYTEPKGKRQQPETERSINAKKSSSGLKSGRTSAGPTHEEIFAHASEKEKKCPKCKAGLPMDTNYCYECGEMLD